MLIFRLDLWVTLFCLTCLDVSLGSSDVIKTFEDDVSTPLFNHLVIDKNTGRVYVGAINRLYQLTPDLDVTNRAVTGPAEDSFECAADSCPNSAVKNLTDNVNKVLVVDYTTSRIISCGSISQGTCTVRSLNNVSDVVQLVKEAVVANNAGASTVAFIAPGPPNSPATQVMYVGVTFTGNSPRRSDVPAIASRSLDSQSMLHIAHLGICSGTRVFVSTVHRESYLINYVYGFSSETFSYFLTTQPHTVTSPSPHISKMVRLCHKDKDYYSYTEIPLECTSKEQSYSLVQAAYVGKIGSDLATDLGITPRDDVLFAVFSSSNRSKKEFNNNLNDQSALCVYSLKSIRKTFFQNINSCFKGKGNRSLDFISPIHPCVPAKSLTITEDFCGMDVNTPLGGDSPMTAIPVLTFNTRLTAVTATSIGDFTVIFVGTNNGHVKKIIVESSVKAVEYGNVVVQENSPINPDLIVGAQRTYLYAMTDNRVSMIEIQKCHMYSSCPGCLAAKDPYCGWCLLENKCSLRSNCEDVANDPLYWIPYNSGKCPTITSVTPNQLQKTTARTLEIVIDNLPLLEGLLYCAFSVFDKTVTTIAPRKSFGVDCTTPGIDLLKSIPLQNHRFTSKLSVKTAKGSNIATTNFTFFDCSTYSSCTQCVNSSFPCDWCTEAHKCTHDTGEYCMYDVLVGGVNRVGPTFRSGPLFCPTIDGTDTGSTYILVPSGIKKEIRVKVHIIGQFIAQTRFVCQFNIEGRVSSVTAALVADTIYCETMEFSYNLHFSNITATFAVIWGGLKRLDNPRGTHIVIYKCNVMAEECSTCLTLPEKYGCGWCQTRNSCEVIDQCDGTIGIWLNRNKTCPNIQITSFWPHAGPWEGHTNITIVGKNLGTSFNDIRSGVTVVGLKCAPYAHLYETTTKIVCRVDGPGSEDVREGPIVVQVEGYRGESKSNYHFVDPIIARIFPECGPKSGGTILRIEGHFMNAGSSIQVFFEETLPCFVVNSTLTETTCITSASDSQRVGRIKMLFDESERYYDTLAYEYTDDPSVESVNTNAPDQVNVPKGIVSGGIKMFVNGKNFAFIQTPRFYVYYMNNKYYGNCLALSDSSLLCESPKITPLQQNQPDPGNPIELDYGFEMDDVADVQNISTKPGFSKFMLFSDPEFDKLDEDITFYKDDYLTINGHHLNHACQETDVTVQIGKSYCIVTSMSRQQLTCRTPPIQPLAPSDGRRLFEIIVTVGSNLKYNIGKRSYAIPEVNSFFSSYILLIPLIVVLLVLILLTVLLFFHLI